MKGYSLSIMFFCFFLTLQLRASTADSILQVLHSLPDDTVKVKKLIALSKDMMNIDTDRVYEYGEMTKQVSEKINYPKGIAIGINLMGISLQMKGETDSSLILFKAAAKLAKEHNILKIESTIMNNIGVNYYSRGDFTQAYIFHKEAYNLAKSQKDTMGAAINLCSMGENLAADNQHLRAIEVLTDSKNLAEKVNNPYLLNMNIILIANSYLKLKNVTKAEEWLNRGMENLKGELEVGDHYVYCLLLNIKARILDQHGKVRLGLRTVEKAEKISREKGFREVLSKSLIISTGLLIKQKQYSSAIVVAKEALQLSTNSGAMDDQKKIFHLLTEAYAGTEDFKTAYLTKIKFNTISDSMAQLTMERNIRDIDYQYQLSQKDAENQLLLVEQEKSRAIIQKRTYASIAVLSLFGLMSLIALVLYRGKIRREKNNQILEQRVKSRTKELEEVNKQLKVSNEELERFAYITSHDLKEPLRNINGFVKLLQREKNPSKDSETEKEYFGFILRNVHQMQQLIDDVLSFSKISSQNIKTSQVNVSKLVEEAKLALTGLIMDKNGTVQLANIPPIYTNTAQLRILLKNLIENGIKYNHNPNPTVSIQYELVENNHHLTISDNGIGIEKRYHHQIFGMFKRLHNRKAYQGSGLGLAICKKIINRLGGDILLKSKLGEGSTFTIILPVIKGEISHKQEIAEEELSFLEVS